MAAAGERGSYAKGIARRGEILDRAAETFGRLGYHATSMRELAASCGLSQAGLQHHFPTKEALMLALVERRDATQTGQHATSSGGRWQDTVLQTLEENLGNRTMTQLWATLAAEATDPDHPAHRYFVDRYARTIEEFTHWFLADGEPSREQADRKARQFVALWDGLQLQWLLDPTFDMRPAFRQALTEISAGQA